MLNTKRKPFIYSTLLNVGNEKNRNYHINWTDHVFTCVCGSVCGYQCVNMYNWNWRLSLIYIQNTNHQNSTTDLHPYVSAMRCVCLSPQMILFFITLCIRVQMKIHTNFSHFDPKPQTWTHYSAHLLFHRIYRQNRKNL